MQEAISGSDNGFPDGVKYRAAYTVLNKLIVSFFLLVQSASSVNIYDVGI